MQSEQERHANTTLGASSRRSASEKRTVSPHRQSCSNSCRTPASAQRVMARRSSRSMSVQGRADRERLSYSDLSNGSCRLRSAPAATVPPGVMHAPEAAPTRAERGGRVLRLCPLGLGGFAAPARHPRQRQPIWRVCQRAPCADRRCERQLRSQKPARPAPRRASPHPRARPWQLRPESRAAARPKPLRRTVRA